MKDTGWTPRERPALSKTNEEGNIENVMEQNYLLKNKTNIFLKRTIHRIFFFVIVLILCLFESADVNGIIV